MRTQQTSSMLAVGLGPGDRAHRVGFAIAPLDEHEETPLPEEASIAREFKAARRASFITGRMLAREAMMQVDLIPGPILRGVSGVPLWPVGCIGSISHSREWVVSVAARDQVYRGVGVDIEQRGRVREALFRRVLTERERDEICDCSKSDRVERATWIFSAKEAVYKAVYPSLRRYIGFDAVQVQIADAACDGPGGAAPICSNLPEGLRAVGNASFCFIADDPGGRMIDSARAHLMLWHDQVIALVLLPFDHP